MADLIAVPTWLAPLVAAPFVGSFLGVLIVRLPAGRAVVWSRSACDHCGEVLTARELVPLLSYAWQRGQCRRCGGAIARLHPAVELAALAVVLPAVLLTRDAALLWVDCLLGWSLLALAWIDWRCLRLPDCLTLPLLLAGLGVTAVREPQALVAHAAAAALGYLSLELVAVIYRSLRHRDGLGAGDAKLFAAACAWVGLAPMPWLLLIAACAGLLAALAPALAGHRIDPTTPRPFGPWLALALWLLWLCQTIPGMNMGGAL